MTSEHHISDLNFSNELAEASHFDLPVAEDLLLLQPLESVQDAVVPQSSGGGKAEPPSSIKVKATIEASDDYLKRRTRNNIAVKKSREKSKQKGTATAENIDRLKVENVELEEKVDFLSKELSVLKKIFMDHARGFSGVGELPDLKQLEKILGHKLTDKISTVSSSGDKPSTSSDDS